MEATTTAPSEAMEATTAPPTAMPAAVAKPDDGAMAGPVYAPSFASYWKPPTDFYGQPVRGGTLRHLYEDPLEHANVWGASGGQATRMRLYTDNHIVQENPYNAGEIVPDLAKGWTQKDDATGVTFFFHDNIKWHQGEAFVCEDARFWIETMLSGEGLTASRQKGNLGFIDIDAVKCLDDLTLEVGFQGPFGVWGLAFAKNNAVVFQKDWFLANGEDARFQDLSQGTGPFLWEEGQRVGVDTQRFERNPNSFKGDGALPYLDNVVLTGILDESSQQAALLAHQGDWHWVRNWGQYDAYVAHPQIVTVNGSTRGHLQFIQNVRKPPFDNVRVRQAVVMSIDRNAAIAVLQDGHGTFGQVMPPGAGWDLDRARACAIPGWCAPEDMKAQRAEAKKILEEEGFDFDKTYIFTVESDQQVVNRATFIQEQMRLVGIKTDFDQLESIAYDTQQFDGSWGDLNDPFMGMNEYHGSKSFSDNMWVPGAPPHIQELQQQVDDLLFKLSTTLDQAERKLRSDELQILIMNNYWNLPVYWEQEAVAFWPEVRGYVHAAQPAGAHVKMEHVWIDPSHKDDKNNSGQMTGVPGGF